MLIFFCFLKLFPRECRDHIMSILLTMAPLLTMCQQTVICLHITHPSEEPHHCYSGHNAPLLSRPLCDSLNKGGSFQMIRFWLRDARHVSITLCVIIVLIMENKWDLLLNINTSITSPINCTLCLRHFHLAKSFQFCQNPLLPR